MFLFELECRNCQWSALCRFDDAVARLRTMGQLRRETSPDEALVSELFVETAPRMTCPRCKEKRLVARPSEDDAGDDWQAAVLCAVCRQPIPPERIEAIPGVERCAACQGKSEAGALAPDELEYCPKCGALVEIRVSRGSGITRYKRVCTGDPPCRL